MKYVVVAVVFLLLGIGAGGLFERGRTGPVEKRGLGDAALEAADSDIRELLSVYERILRDGRAQSPEACALLAISVIQRRSSEVMSRDLSGLRSHGSRVTTVGTVEQWAEPSALPMFGRGPLRSAPRIGIPAWKQTFGGWPAIVPRDGSRLPTADQE